MKEHAIELLRRAVGNPRAQFHPGQWEAMAELMRQWYRVLHEGKTLHQYVDRCEDRPRYVVRLSAIADKPDWLKAATHYKLVFRSIANSMNERSVIAACIAGAVFDNSALSERAIESRRSCDSLGSMAIVNSFTADWSLCVKSRVSVSLFLLNAIPIAPFAHLRSFLGHAALRLICNHAGYAALRQEQLACEWRETRPPHCWPVLHAEEFELNPPPAASGNQRGRRRRQ
jgi:hypothetical protein